MSKPRRGCFPWPHRWSTWGDRILVRLARLGEVKLKFRMCLECGKVQARARRADEEDPS